MCSVVQFPRCRCTCSWGGTSHGLRRVSEGNPLTGERLGVAPALGSLVWSICFHHPNPHCQPSGRPFSQLQPPIWLLCLGV